MNTKHFIKYGRGKQTRTAQGIILKNLPLQNGEPYSEKLLQWFCMLKSIYCFYFYRFSISVTFFVISNNTGILMKSICKKMMWLITFLSCSNFWNFSMDGVKFWVDLISLSLKKRITLFLLLCEDYMLSFLVLLFIILLLIGS